MFKRIGVLALLPLFVFSVSGCATARKQKDLEMQGLRNQISALQVQLQSKDEEINSLRDSLATADQEKAASMAARKQSIPEIKSRPKIKQVQIALRNAGYNPGTIDGKMGRQTRDAIKSFQRANGLVADGKVGKRTWELLRRFLSKKIK